MALPNRWGSRFVRLALVSSFGLMSGCDTTFDPRGSFEHRLVMYGLLTPGSDTVMVRLQSTFDSQSGSPSDPQAEPELTGATGSILWDRFSTSLRDTVVPHPDSTRYSHGLRVLMAAPLSLTRGQAYTVRVDVPGYPRAEATTVIPGLTDVYFRNPDLLRRPNDYPGTELDLVIGLPSNAYGYLPRLVIEYSILSEGGRIEQTEVPVSVSGNSGEVEYPQLRGTSSARPPGSSWYEFFVYQANAYRHTIGTLAVTYGADNLRYRRAVLYLTIVDQQLYSYYFVVNGFFDPFTVRTDQPDHSNVVGGVGLIGSYAVDSVEVLFP